VNNNPLRYTDPTGHRACGDGEEVTCGGHLTNPTKNTKSCTGKDCHGKETAKQKEKQTQECTSTHPCLQPKPQNPSWWDLDPSHPDYYVLSASVGPPGLPGLTATLTIDRYKNIYGGLGGNYGKSMEAFSASLTGGSIGSPLDEKVPDPVNIKSFLTGWAVNGGTGIVGGGGITYSSGANETFVSKTAVEYGGFLPPSIGVSDVYSWELGNPFISGDQ
jgi:hypothetical protein